ncbi:hypothetical protein [Methylomonas sp.]|nr:hypothetical protein [Methylomonas sp.]
MATSLPAQPSSQRRQVIMGLQLLGDALHTRIDSGYGRSAG